MSASVHRLFDDPDSRRSSSRSIASRMKSERFSFGRRTASMRASVPSGKRAGVCSSLIFVRPTGRFVAAGRISVKPCILLISPILTGNLISSK